MNARTHIAMTVLTLVASVGFSAAQNPAVQAGNGIQLTLRGVPADEAAQVNGIYKVSDAGGIRLPLLNQPVRVAGLKPDQVAKSVEDAYKHAGIYQRPAVEAVVIQQPDRPEGAKVSVGGKVKAPGWVGYRQGMTLLEAIQAAGDRTEFGSRHIELIRKGKLMKFDLTDPATKNFEVLPADVITVPSKPPFERGG